MLAQPAPSPAEPKRSPSREPARDSQITIKASVELIERFRRPVQG